MEQLSGAVAQAFSNRRQTDVESVRESSTNIYGQALAVLLIVPCPPRLRRPRPTAPRLPGGRSARGPCRSVRAWSGAERRRANLGSSVQLLECSLDQGDGRIAVDIPMRDEQGAPSGIEECARQPGKCLGTFCFPRPRVAGGQDHPISIEL
jgi:hypothetical protein